jgi:hypothetical protein
VLDFVALQVGIFLNRLSDYLFTAARFAVSTEYDWCCSTTSLSLESSCHHFRQLMKLMAASSVVHWCWMLVCKATAAQQTTIDTRVLIPMSCHHNLPLDRGPASLPTVNEPPYPRTHHSPRNHHALQAHQEGKPEIVYKKAT